MFEFAKHCRASRLVKLGSEFDLLMAIREKPLQKRNAIAIAKKFKFTDVQLVSVIGMPLKSYTRMKPSSLLSVGASERIIKLAELYGIGVMTFDGDAKSFVRWLNTTIPALMNHIPFELMTTFVGISLIREELLRMEYGVVQ